MSSNELLNIINRYFIKEENNVYFIHDDTTSEKSLKELIPFFQKLIQSESPDIYAVHNNTVLLIEHFEFDSSKSNKKGSLYKRENARIDRKFDNIKLIDTNPEILIHDVIHGEPSFKNLKNNLLKTFDNHYIKIPDYINNLINIGILDDNKSLKTAFFIEDTSPLGNIYIDNHGNPQHLNIFHADFFVEKLLCLDNQLDCIFYGFYYGSEYYLWFLDLKSLKNILDNIELIDGSGFCTLTPHSLGFVGLIPKMPVVEVGDIDD